MDDEGHQIGYLVLPQGTPVVTSDGVEIGRVAQVLDNAREHIFDGIVVRTESRTVFVDAPEVARIAERRVTLTITAEQARHLPERALRGWKGWFG
jgi:sporulation protein YlmC with PRC-barrel domain